MANTLAALIRSTSSGLLQNFYGSVRYSKVLQPQVRYLYSKTTLGLDGFELQRERTKAQLSNIIDKFRVKMNDYTTDDSKNMIFTEDLKNMVHLAENDQDVDLVIRMMKRFNQQNKELRFGHFVFGPVVMRMFHSLNKPDEALQCFKSPDLSGFFDQLMTYQILLDLLYENKKYNEMLDTFELIKERQLEGTKYPRNIVVLTFAACYKLNTPESFQFAMKLWADLMEIGHLPMRRAITFLSGLAYNQGNFAAALEVVSSSRNQNYTTIRNLKVAALVGVGRMEDAIPILKSILSEDAPTNAKHTFNKEVLDTLKTAVEKSDNPDIKIEFERLEKYFKEQGHISEVSLDEQLCSEIALPAFIKASLQYQNNANRYQKYNQNRPNKPRFPRRPGLAELQ